MEGNKINKAHPELEKGEVFFANVSNDASGFFHDYCSWASVKWKTKRRSRIAYNINDNPMEGSSPVFVQREELIKAGINPDKLRD